MANLCREAGIYYVRFRCQAKEYKRSLKVRERSDAEAARRSVEQTIHRLLVGLLTVPDSVDPADFIARGAGGAGGLKLFWEAVRSGGVLDLTLRDHAAALAREGLTGERRRWDRIVRDHPDLRPDLVESDTGALPNGQQAATALWKLGYEPRAAF
jgi:hypothetical protein